MCCHMSGHVTQVEKVTPLCMSHGIILGRAYKVLSCFKSLFACKHLKWETILKIWDCYKCNLTKFSIKLFYTNFITH